MQAQLGHLQFNINRENLNFYKELLAFLEWTVLYETADLIGVADPNGASLWFMGIANDAKNDYDGAGLNHLAFGVAAQRDVDAAVSFLQEKGISLLFDTPRHRPDFAQGADQTYYQVMFESPDRILMEVVYMGVKA